MQLGLPSHNSECSCWFPITQQWNWCIVYINSTPLHTAKLTYTIEMSYPRRMSKEHLEAATRAGKNKPSMLASKGGSKKVANYFSPSHKYKLVIVHRGKMMDWAD